MNLPTHPRFQNLLGQRFGCLRVAAYAGRRCRRTYWRCQCTCGATTDVWAANLKNGHTRSCGCLVVSANTTHGMTHSSEYRSWHMMKQRCHPQHGGPNYAGRGIAVCPRWWRSFATFLKDMGLKPTPQHSIERIDNNGDYERDNCRWATQKEQNRNTRANHLVTYRGKTLPVIAWCELTGVSKNCLLTRLNRGWSVEDALEFPVSGKRGRRQTRRLVPV